MQELKILPDKETVEAFCRKYYTLKPRLNQKEHTNAVLRQAVWSGKIKKPKTCSRCGSSEKRICGHHSNGYSKEHAIDVIWLCDSCHSVEHSRR